MNDTKRLRVVSFTAPVDRWTATSGDITEVGGAVLHEALMTVQQVHDSLGLTPDYPLPDTARGWRVIGYSSYQITVQPILASVAMVWYRPGVIFCTAYASQIRPGDLVPNVAQIEAQVPLFTTGPTAAYHPLSMQLPSGTFALYAVMRQLDCEVESVSALTGLADGTYAFGRTYLTLHLENP